MAALGAVLLLSIVVSSFVLVGRWSEAPGSASPINPLVKFDAVKNYSSKGKLLFVTVSSGQLNGLAAFQGWIDPDVDELTKKERFGTATPEQDRQIGLRQMHTAAEDAPYVALTKLGYPTVLQDGPVVIDQVLCLVVNPKDNQVCDKYVPAGDFLKRGDEIEAINGTPIANQSDLTKAMKAGNYKAGQQVQLTVQRGDPNTGLPGGAKETGSVTLFQDPNDATHVLIGIQTADTRTVKLPFPVTIDSGDVGGPSAGLAFTLDIIDQMTPGDLTGGKKVAVTGTIDVDGNVGAIGGIHQKAIAVKQAGGQAFIIPASQSAADIAIVKKILGAANVYTVTTLDEALAVLAKLGGNALDIGTPGKNYTPAPASSGTAAPSSTNPATPATPATPGDDVPGTPVASVPATSAVSEAPTTT